MITRPEWRNCRAVTSEIRAAGKYYIICHLIMRVGTVGVGKLIND